MRLADAQEGVGILKTVFGIFAAASILVSILVFACLKVDESGWLVHHHDTPIWIDGDWMVGEYRECEMLTTTPVVEGTRYTKDELMTLPRLFCSQESGAYFKWASSYDSTDVSWPAMSKYFHVLPVTYFGRLERPSKWRVSWHCQRKEDSVACKALD